MKQTTSLGKVFIDILAIGLSFSMTKLLPAHALSSWAMILPASILLLILVLKDHRAYIAIVAVLGLQLALTLAL